MKLLDEFKSNIKILEMFHYIYGGICCFFGLFPIFHIVIGILILTNAFPHSNQGQELPKFFGYIFVIAGSIILLFSQTLGVLTIISGRKIAKLKSRNFSLVIAGINCIGFPFGTVLGVFALMMLTKDEAKILYGEINQNE